MQVLVSNFLHSKNQLFPEKICNIQQNNEIIGECKSIEYEFSNKWQKVVKEHQSHFEQIPIWTN